MSLYFSGYVFAQEEINAEDKIIGSTFKTLAKAFVAVVDLDKLKASNVNKLGKMDEKKFNRRYIKVYESIKDLPFNLKFSYGITVDMRKEQAIKNIESLDKNKIYAIIDSVPDAFIARQFNRYINEKKQDIKKINLAGEINKLWSKIIENTSKLTSNNSRIAPNN